MLEKDEKVINSLEGEITCLQEEVKVHQEIIVKLEVEKEEFKQEVAVSHKLIS
jgi:predicted RNase H-like nuclease (RuvC/YqgF family)